jgi:formylglycine-generating enzyme required for sulfatase activity
VAEGVQHLQVRQPTSKIFISYSRRDIAFAVALQTALKKRGFEPLIDRTEIYAFEDWWKRIEDLIASADTVVFVLSPDSVASDVALTEARYAASLNKRFAPIVFRHVDQESVPGQLRRLNYIFFDEPSRFDASVDSLAEALQIDLDWIRRHTEFTEAARRWSAAGRPGPYGLLLRSPLLEQAERWISSRPSDAPEPTEETRLYIKESRRAANRRRTKTRAVASAFVATTLSAIAAWLYQDTLKERLYWFTSVRGHPLTLAQEHALRPDATFKECAGCPSMVLVPPDMFTMGSPDVEKDRDVSEGPQHRVTIPRAFAVGKFPTTFAEWDACVAHGDCSSRISDSGFGRGEQPAINVSWDDAQVYVAWLRRMTGKPYRLLSEAEWEYVARAGTTTAYYWGDDVGVDNANCNGCRGQSHELRPTPVGSFPPNPFGVYDMAGNVFQWTQDCWNEDHSNAPADGSARLTGDCDGHVVRGGPWNFKPNALRTARRDAVAHEVRSANIGFRVARTIIVDHDPVR